jgi:hypothetical protein
LSEPSTQDEPVQSDILFLTRFQTIYAHFHHQ